MQTLHLRASELVIQQLMANINQLAEQGNEIEILDNLVYEKEAQMIKTSLEQLKKGVVFSHEEIWQELLH